MKQKAVAAFAERAKRPSQLSLPLEAYVGKYTSEHFGTAYIATNGKDLTVRMGKIKVVATNYTEKESIRVEMVPGSGEVVRFIKDGDGKIVSLNLAGGTFLKAGS